MVRPARLLVCSILCVVATAATLPAAEVATPPGQVDYLKDVKPLLAARCFACHGSLKQEGSLRLDTAAAIRTGGDSGPAAVPKDVAASVLFERISDKDPATRMPPEGEGAPFKPAEIELIRAWIAAGAPGPTDEKPEADPREHWAFRAPQRPPVPQVKNSAWVRNPIDRARKARPATAARGGARPAAAARLSRSRRPAADPRATHRLPGRQVSRRL